jgi:FkbM family methyltransferase
MENNFMRHCEGFIDKRVLLLVLLSVLLMAAIFLFFQGSSVINPRYVFVDCGAHLGETIAHFERTNIYQQHDWEMFSFEANPNLIEKIPKKPNLTIIDKAVWVDDSGIDFFIGKSTASSSVIKEKSTGQLSTTPTRVGSVDFGKWLTENFTSNDFVFVKLDIEGAEYDVLEKMLSDGSIELVDALYIEFHNIKVGVPIERDLELLAAIKRYGILTKVNPLQRRDGDWFGS